MNNYNIKSLIKKIILVTSITIFILLMIISLNDIQEIIGVLKNTNLKYVFFAFLILLVYIILWPLSLHIIVRRKDKNIKIVDSMMIGGSEFFFNGITPFSSGGQPFQVYAYNEVGIKPANSTGILMINFILYQISITILCALAMIFYYQKLVVTVPNIPILLIIGFSINLLILGLILLLGIFKPVKTWLNRFMNWLCKFTLFKKILENRIPQLNLYIDEVQIAFKEVLRAPLVMVFSLLLKLVGLAFYYAIPYFAMCAVGVQVDIRQLFYVISMTSFAMTMVVWIPTPGGTGGAELAFTTLFISLVNNDKSIAMGSMLIWRMITYYLVMILGFVMYLYFEKRREKNANRNI